MQEIRNKKILISVMMVVMGMFLLGFAAVPLYSLFCKVTGFGGTTQVAKQAPNIISDRVFVVEFNADVNQNLDWDFKPVQRKVKTVPGKSNLVHYFAKNNSNEDIVGVANFNVTPNKAGKYFSKIECFCFTKQKLRAGQKQYFPVSFFIDPDIVHDPYLKDVNVITLSYSFFREKN